MTEPEPCPNPKCGSIIGPMYGFAEEAVTCTVCGLRGPYADTRDGAAELWNSLPRASAWIDVKERLPECRSDSQISETVILLESKYQRRNIGFYLYGTGR